MSFWLEPELQQYFDVHVPMRMTLHMQQQQQQDYPTANDDALRSQLRAAAVAALAADPALSFMLKLDSVLGVRGCVVTCLATVRRNVHQHELVYLQRFKQVAEPAVRHPKNKEQLLFCLDPKTLRCGQQVLVRVQLRRSPTEPLQLLREFAVLRASGNRDPAMFPKGYLFGCLGDDVWHLSSTDKADQRSLTIHKRHFLICQYAEDSLQRLLDTNRSQKQRLEPPAASHLAKDMLFRLKHLHSLGWSHDDLRPASFLILGSPDEILLGDFASAAPVTQDCLTFDETSDQRDPTYRSERFPRGQMFADLESLVYILWAVMSPLPLPWEQADASAAADAAATATARRQKLAAWQFAAAKDPEARAKLWSAADSQLPALFNCSGPEAAADHMACKLAAAVIRLHEDWTTTTTSAAADNRDNKPSPDESGLPARRLQPLDYATLFACLRE